MKDFYFNFIELWKKLCELHSQLYDFTCDEYSVLLSGEVEQLELVGKKKEKLMGLITNLDEYRDDLIKHMKNFNSNLTFEKVIDVIQYFKDFEKENSLSLLENLNTLLIDIIEKIKEQNKKNQIFLHKSIRSFEQIRQGLQGNYQHRIYNSKGYSIGLKSS